jgi:RluA family pseudouridine synthase
MLTVLYEDDDMLAVDKPHGMPTIPGYDRESKTVLGLLSEQIGGRLFVVHRLDGASSGVLLFAKNAEAHRALNLAFEHREVHKTYRALTHGVINTDRGVIEAPLRRFGSGRMGVDAKRGKACRTEYRVLRRLAGYTLVEAYPITGRRHQLRVHYYHLGHALVGDPKYGDLSEQARYPRLMLHAHRIRLTLPSGTEHEITAPLPPSFQGVVDALQQAVVR